MSLRRDKEHFVKKESPPSQALVSPEVDSSDEICKQFRKGLTPFLTNLLRSRSLIGLVRHGLWGKAAMFCKSVSPLPCSLALKTWLVYGIHFCFSMASTHSLGRQPLGTF